ncbi:MAG TPA: tRNA (cytidine(34)-2'-O)-methyltransferase [Candidatus Ozemobacteraceae bacterium]
MNERHLPPDSAPPLHVALVMPDIPQNTGNIARLCRATGAQLVLVRPLGFRLTDTQLERAGMDYWKQLSPLILDDLDAFETWAADKRVWYLSAHGTRLWAEVAWKPGDVLVFGSESEGLPRRVLEAASIADRLVTLPMLKGTRCINVSAAAAAVVYEALRQINGWQPIP